MSFSLQSLKPVECTSEIVLSAIESMKQPDEVAEMQIINLMHPNEKSKIIAFLVSLMSSPKFAELVPLAKTIISPKELQFGPELCGQDIFDKYLHDAEWAFRFLSMLAEIKSIETPTSVNFSFFETINNESKEILGSLLLFVETMTKYIDTANCWPYLPLPEVVPKIIFDNPLRKFFGSRYLNTIEPSFHVYSIKNGITFQQQVLETNPLLDAPEAICFVSENSNSTIAKCDLPQSLIIPLGVSQTDFKSICERMHTWKNSGAPNDKLEKVISGYKDSIKFIQYRLISFQGEAKQLYLAVMNNPTKMKKVEKPAEFDNLLINSALYEKI